jgi:hypothetical protein
MRNRRRSRRSLIKTVGKGLLPEPSQILIAAEDRDRYQRVQRLREPGRLAEQINNNEILPNLEVAPSPKFFEVKAGRRVIRLRNASC